MTESGHRARPPEGGTVDERRDRWLRAATVVLATVVVLIVSVGLWSVHRIADAAREVEENTAMATAYQHVRTAVAEQAFAEAAYRRSPGPDSRARLEASVDLLDDAVAEVRDIGTSTDRATVTHLLALNGRYVAEVRSALRDGATPPPIVRDDRVAGPALDAIYDMTTAALQARTESVRAATAHQREVIHDVIVLLPLVTIGGALIVVACWWVITRRHLRLADRVVAADRAADHDPLTGLANRRAFERRLDELLADPDASTGLLLIDLDEFKALNDTLGHPMGDAGLVAMAERFAAVVRGSDMVARLGGDEFGVIVPGVSDLGGLATRLVRVGRVPLELGAERWTLGASIGGAHAIHGDDRAALVARADASLYRAKQAGRNRYVIGDDDACAVPFTMPVQRPGSSAERAPTVDHAGAADVVAPAV